MYMRYIKRVQQILLCMYCLPMVGDQCQFLIQMLLMPGLFALWAC